MKNKEWHFMDKSEWGPGVWQDEPDKAQWMDKATGFPCLIVRNQLGALCGYVGVAQGHPCFEKDYDSFNEIQAHGGLTFAAFCRDGEHGICHVVEPGENDRVWWLGFDCAHFQDYVPGMAALTNKFAKTSAKLGASSLHYRDIYRDFAYVKKEIRELAAQLAKLSSK